MGDVGTMAAGPKLVEMSRSPEGTIHLKLQNAGTEAYTLQVSPDLTSWIPLHGQQAVAGNAEFSDTRAAEFKTLFYRAAAARADEIANPLAVEVRLDPAITASAVLSPQGGSLALTNASGTVIELTFPEGALESDTLVRMTLVSQIAGLPFSGGLLAAIQMEPEGLELRVPAVIKFRLASLQSANELVAFAYRGLGQSFHLVTDDTLGNVASVRISHFSGAGVGLGTQDDLAKLNVRFPASPSDRFEAGAAFINFQIRNQAGQPTATSLDALEALHRQFYTSVLDPTLRAANTSPEFFGEATSAWLIWKTQADQPSLTNRLQVLLEDAQILVSQADSKSDEFRSGWRRLDANGDGRVDSLDNEKLFAPGIWKPTIDINRDGKMDIQDFWEWVLFMSRWDRNGDRAVSSEDFRPIIPVTLPVTDTKVRDAIVQAALNPARLSLPSEYEEKLLARLTNAPSTDNHAKSQILTHGGAAALTQHNLEVARWSFARACQLEPTNSSAMVNLAFTFAEDGRFQEALQLLAETLALEPTCATAWNNLGTIYARHGQSAEALKCYESAVQYAPSAGQYHLNRAVSLLQSGSKAAAIAAATSAARLSPGDSEARMFSLAIHPPQPGNLAALETEYEHYRQDPVQFPGNDTPPAWSQLDFGERARAILELPDYQFSKKLEADLIKLRDDTMDLVRKEFDNIRPKWVTAEADMAIFLKHFPSTVQALMDLDQRAQIEATNLARSYERQEAGAKLSMDQVVLQLALAQAQIEMSRYPNANEARQAFELVIDELYEEPMRDAARDLRHAGGLSSVSLPSPEYSDMLQWSGGLGFFIITTGGAVDPEGYGKGFVAPPKIFAPFDLSQVPAEGSLGFSLAGGAVQVEYNFKTEEQKIQVGEGLVVAGTWHPKTGYGFQIGFGYDLALAGVGGIGNGIYAKFGSDGSLSISVEGSAGVSAGPVGSKVTISNDIPIFASSHPPIMSPGDIFRPAPTP